MTHPMCSGQPTVGKVVLRKHKIYSSEPGTTVLKSRFTWTKRLAIQILLPTLSFEQLDRMV